MRLLLLGCHCDDIELGCGSTIHKYKDDFEIYCSVFCSQGYQEGKLVPIDHIARESLHSLGAKQIDLNLFTPDEFYNHRQEIWRHLNYLREQIKPNIIITQSNDEHQDHETLYKESVRVFRQDTLLTYPVSRSQRSFCPDTYECVNYSDVASKLSSVNLYREFYTSKNYLAEDNVLAQMRANGVYVNTPFAEVYQTVTRRNLIDLGKD